MLKDLTNNEDTIFDATEGQVRPQNEYENLDGNTPDLPSIHIVAIESAFNGCMMSIKARKCTS